MTSSRAAVIGALAVVASLGVTAQAYAIDGWVQRGSTIDGAAGDRFGWSVAMSADGSVFAVGARTNDDAGTDAGQVNVYEWSGTSWLQRGSDINGEAADDESGYSVAMSADGNVIAIGAPGNAAGGLDRGHVRVYSWDGISWNQRGADIDGESDLDDFGSSVALSSDGTIVAIGAPRNDDAGSQAGHVRAYAWDGTNWNQRGSDIDGEATGDSSGSSVALSSDGTIIAIGAPRNDDAGASAGQVRVYSWDGNSWNQRGSDIDGEDAGTQLGRSVALSSDGTVIAAGGPFNTDGGVDAGHVEVYAWNGNTWSQRGSDINGEAGDEFGSSVAMSADGSTVAVGAPTFSDIASDAGRVRAYLWDGSVWTQRGETLNGVATNDEFGTSVALSANASMLAVGAPIAGGGTSAGQVRVFAWPTNEAVTPGPATYFTFLLPDGRECSAISPQRVQVGTMVELPGVDALCQTMSGSSVAGWTIPVPHEFTGYGSSFEPFPPGLRVRVIESQRFTLVPFEPIIQIDYDANIAVDDTCTPANLAHTSEDGRVEHVWVPRADFAVARTPAQAPCAPDGHQLTGWNTAGDGSGDTLEPGAPLPDSWAEGAANHHKLHAVWMPSS